MAKVIDYIHNIQITFSTSCLPFKFAKEKTLNPVYYINSREQKTEKTQKIESNYRRKKEQQPEHEFNSKKDQAASQKSKTAKKKKI